ncbi:MAG: DUF5682 family protein [Saprospiraceae bacterium]
MESEIKVLGIRHHGAGSCLRTMQSLQDFKPDHICIELPYEAADLINQLNTKEIEFPVAMLFYSPKKINKSTYLPLAEFSPELQAILYGLNHSIPITPIDLPIAIQYQLNSSAEKLTQNLSFEQKNMIRDPIGYLAKLDGFQDGEMWWETHIEHNTESKELFELILSLMTTLRVKSNHQDDLETLLREEWMVKTVNQIKSSSYKKIAIVCGAWHAPIFNNPNQKTKLVAKYEQQSKLEIKSCLIPWSFERLALNQHYTAGIQSPVWHQFLFKNKSTAVSAWLSHAAKILRNFKYAISTAQIIDAVLLARQIATLRQHTLPCIEDLLDSSIATFCEGKSDLIEFIKTKALIGNQRGNVPINQNSLPFQQIFYEKLKKTKLLNLWESGESKEIHLDLRKELHFSQAQFFNFCLLLSIPWCAESTEEIQSHGNFKEEWSTKWNPDIEHRIIEISLLGNSIEEVITNYINKKISETNSLGLLCTQLMYLLKSGEKYGIDILLSNIQTQANFENDVSNLSELIHPLYHAIQYGSLYQYESEILTSIVDRIVPKCILLLPSASIGNDPIYGKKVIKTIQRLNLYIENQDSYKSEWGNCLLSLLDSNKTHPMVSGKVWQILLSQENPNHEKFAAEISYVFDHLSEDQQLLWIEGFFTQNQSFYSFPKTLLQSLDNWLIGLSSEKFSKALLFLRRTFADVNPQDKLKLLHSIQKIKNPNPIISQKEINFIISENRTAIIQSLFSNT